MEMGLVKRDGTFYLTARPVSYEAGLVKKKTAFDQTGVRCKDKFLPRIGKDHTLRIISDTVSTELYLNDVAITSVAHLFKRCALWNWDCRKYTYKKVGNIHRLSFALCF